jgi:hypothetical protein
MGQTEGLRRSGESGEVEGSVYSIERSIIGEDNWQHST